MYCTPSHGTTLVSFARYSPSVARCRRTVCVSPASPSVHLFSESRPPLLFLHCSLLHCLCLCLPAAAVHSVDRPIGRVDVDVDDAGAGAHMAYSRTGVRAQFEIKRIHILFYPFSMLCSMPFLSFAHVLPADRRSRHCTYRFRRIATHTHTVELAFSTPHCRSPKLCTACPPPL